MKVDVLIIFAFIVFIVFNLFKIPLKKYEENEKLYECMLYAQIATTFAVACFLIFIYKLIF